jgi:GT2 family glycosyltransferase
MNETLETGISVLVLTYNTDVELLDASIRSVLNSRTHLGSVFEHLEVLIADNASGQPPRIDPSWPTTYPVRIVSLGANHGYPGGTNLGIEACSPRSDLIFSLNADATVEPNALAECESALRTAHQKTIAVAPKMLLKLGAHYEGLRLIDTVGNAVNPLGEGTNIGLGQPDVGQFDVAGQCFGACFGAAMFRRSAFHDAEVGPLMKSLFLYYEDVEWSWRAQHLGYDTISAPKAVVWHHMSMHVRHLGYGFKVRFLERNLLLINAIHRSPRSALAVWRRRIPALFGNARRGHYPRECLRAALEAFAHLPTCLRMRVRFGSRMQRVDAEILHYADGDRTFFDHVSYRPEISLQALSFAFSKLALAKQETAPSETSARIDRLALGRQNGQIEEVQKLTAELRSEFECFGSSTAAYFEMAIASQAG